MSDGERNFGYMPYDKGLAGHTDGGNRDTPMTPTHEPGYGHPGALPDAYSSSRDQIRREEEASGEAFLFSEKTIRRSFIRKVYLILTAQLLVTIGFILFFLLHKPTQDWVQRHSWFYYLSYGVFLATYIMLACCSSVRRKFPGNFIALSIFTLALSYMTATISSYYGTRIVLIAVAITAAVCLAVTLFAVQTKIDFTMCSGLLFALVMVLLFFGLACLIVYFTDNFKTWKIMSLVYAALGSLVMSLFLAYNTQMIMGGKRHELSPEEYIYGALQLYLDIVFLFMFIACLVGGSN